MAVKLKWEVESCINDFFTRLVVTYCVFELKVKESSFSAFMLNL